jgi:hypothetical protein
MARVGGQPSHLVPVLKAAVRLSRFPYREIERQLGMHAGALSRLLNGGIELKVRHVEEICRVIQLSPGRLLRAAYPVAEDAPGGKVEEALGRLHGTPAPPPARPARAASVDLDDFERSILAALRKFFAELGN